MGINEVIKKFDEWYKNYLSEKHIRGNDELKGRMMDAWVMSLSTFNLITYHSELRELKDLSDKEVIAACTTLLQVGDILRTNTINRLKAHGIMTMAQLMVYKASDLTKIPGIGRVAIDQIMRYLQKEGYKLKQGVSYIKMAEEE